MSKEADELKKQIESLKSELAASMRREELKDISNGSRNSYRQKIKNKIKSTRLWKAADDPNDKLGKIIRSPRTIMRIITNPRVVKEIREKNNHVRKKDDDNNNEIFMPIRFFFGKNSEKRINVILDEIDMDMVRMGAMLANSENVELRVVATKEKVDAVWYRQMIKKKSLPEIGNVSFYNTTEQNTRARVFELEISENDVFLTRAWMSNE